MSFLRGITQGVSRAAEQAKFEADKLMQTNKINSELGELTRQAAQINASIGAKVSELQAEGKIHIPELDELIAQLKNLDSLVAAKKAELEAVKNSKFEAAVPSAAPTPTPAAPTTATRAAAPTMASYQEVKCPNCGAAVAPGTKFCPSCGQKL